MAISDAIAAAPIEYFPIDSAPIEKIPIDIAPIEKVPIDITPIARSNAIDIAARLIIPMAIQPKLNTPKEIIPTDTIPYDIFPIATIPLAFLNPLPILIWISGKPSNVLLLLYSYSNLPPWRFIITWVDLVSLSITLASVSCNISYSSPSLTKLSIVTLYISDNIINFFKSGIDCPVSHS